MGPATDVDVSPVLSALLSAAGLGEVRAVRPVDQHGYGLDNRLTLVELADGRRVLLRQSRVEPRSPEARIRFLRGNGIDTPTLYAADGAGASLWEFLPGRPMADVVADGGATDAVWARTGAALARIHAVTLPPPLQGEIGPVSLELRPLDPVKDLRERLVTGTGWAGRHRPELRGALAEVAHHIDRRAGEIERTRPAVTHGDVNLLNIVVGDDESVRFIDWDFPAVRYPLAELSALDEHAYLHGLDGLPPAFFGGYGAEVPPDLLLTYRIVGCLAWLASDDWAGWESDEQVPAAARRRLHGWHGRLLSWLDGLPSRVDLLR